MAIRKIITCHNCMMSAVVWCSPSSYPKMCDACETAIAKKAKTDFMSAHAAMTTDERLAAIESWMYDHGLVKHGYIPEPRF